MAFPKDPKAAYKAVCYFDDGKRKTFYSWDLKRHSKVRDPQYGLEGLKKRIVFNPTIGSRAYIVIINCLTNTIFEEWDHRIRKINK